MENTISTPTIIKRIEQKEINEIGKMLSDCQVLPVNLIKAYLVKQGKTDKQIECILNQTVKRKIAYYDDSKMLLKLNKAFSVSNMNKGIVKSLWLMLDLFNNIEEYFIQTKSPHTLTFFNKNATSAGLPPIYDVFYIPYDREQIDNFIINEMGNAALEKLNVFIILDSEEQKNKIILNNNINVVSFLMKGEF